ncbi:hypothetical protein MRB53_013321 [Persea americana]|uniref:Uncharacterized protein n=1 Tax=Persea americana TaxID=3435 RepID=A0ACC2K7T7_PERAE|nr:hypothetical protein MRB53_013321 [Persea americana]
MNQTQEPKDPVHYNEDAQESEGGEEEEEEEEALSLCDLAIDKGTTEKEDDSNEANRDNPDQDRFEFFNDLNTEMCSADDIFLSGRILPFKSSSVTHAQRNEDGNLDFLHMRSGSVDETRCSRTRYHTLERASSSKESTKKQTQIVNRVQNGKRVGIGEVSAGRVSYRPRWCLLIFGSMRGPPVEMEMKDIRHRQMRRNPPPGSLFRASERREGAVSGGKEAEGKISWKLLRALSCKGHANSVATDPFRCIPHVRTM